MLHHLACESGATAKSVRKPNLFIVGAPKCGTTAWYEYLRTHPEIFFPELKEPHYFATDLPGRRIVTSEKEYLALFEAAKLEHYIGDASVYYLYSELAAGLIHQFNPNARILILLRDQADMLPSLHHHHLYSFEEGLLDFETAWRLTGKRPADTIPSTCPEVRILDYLSVGKFHSQVSRYFDIFPSNQILVMQYDKWIECPRSAYLRILSFLGLEDDGREIFDPVNEAKGHRFETLGKFMQHPPKAVARAASFVKRLLGISTFGLARANQRPGYRSKVSPALQAEIRRRFQSDNAALGDLLRQYGK